jgi:hypothetical protein
MLRIVGNHERSDGVIGRISFGRHMANQAQRIIERARRLPARERRRVVSALEASLAKPPNSTVTPTRRGRSYEGLLALAGTAHADATDVSTDKYAHLAAAYADDDA